MVVWYDEESETVRHEVVSRDRVRNIERSG